VVTSHDHVGDPVVLSDDRVPQRFPRSGHPHGQGQQGKGRLTGLVARQQLTVTSDPRVRIDITGLCRAHHRVDQQVRASRS